MANQRISVFGFTAALLESLPIVGLVFTVSNRVGAAMWAHGLFLPSLFSIIIMFEPDHS